MPEIRCDTCRAILAVRDADIGKRVRCPHCGMITDYRDQPPQEAGESYLPHGGHYDAGPADAARQLDDQYLIDEDTDHWSLKTPEGMVYGPVPRGELDEWEKEGRVSAKFLVQRIGQTHWQSALVLYPHLATARPIPADRTSRERDRSAVGTGSRRNRRLRSNNGIAILIIAALGLAFLPGVIFGLIAWIMGRAERRAMDRGECSRNNEFLVHAGYYLGILATLTGLVIWLGCCVVIRRF